LGDFSSLREVSSNLRKVRSFNSKSTESTLEISIDEQERSADSPEATKVREKSNSFRLRRAKTMYERCSTEVSNKLVNDDKVKTDL